MTHSASPTPTRWRDRILGSWGPGFLAFVTAPYFYFTGASYETARLKELRAGDLGFASSAGDRIYSGFNIFANNTLPNAVPYLLWGGVSLFFFVPAVLWIAKSGDIRAARMRSKSSDVWTWIKRQIEDLGLVLSPLAGLLGGMLTLALFLGWLGLMSFGQKDGQRDARRHRAAISACVAAQGRKNGCTIIGIRGPDGKIERIVGGIVAMDKDRALISNGQTVFPYEAKQVVSVTEIQSESRLR